MDIFNTEAYLDSYIARFIRKKLYVNGMIYNPALRRFEPAMPLATAAVFRDIDKECFDFFEVPIELRQSNRILEAIEKIRKRVQETTNFNPVRKTISGSITPTTVPVFQHVILQEEISETSLLSLGRGRFIVVSTNRSTLKEGDILTAISSPWNSGSREGVEFNITRDSKKFIPSELQKTVNLVDYEIEYRFKTQPLKEVVFLFSPEILQIVDSNASDLHTKPQAKNDITANGAISFIETVQQVISQKGLEKETYTELLDYARYAGVGSYVLNLIIELTFNKQESLLGIYSERDWVSNIPENVLMQIKEEERKRKEAEVEMLRKEYLANLKTKLRRGTYLLVFKRSGYYSKQDEKELKGISDRLDKLAAEGYGTMHWAERERSNYLKKFEVKPKDNLILVLKITAVIVVLGCVAAGYYSVKNGLDRFNKASETGLELLANGQYTEAQEIYQQAYDDYTPRISLLLVMFRHERDMEAIKKAIDAEVTKGVEDINTFLKADKGRFKTHTEELLLRLLELRPEHPQLLELKEKWLKQ